MTNQADLTTLNDLTTLIAATKELLSIASTPEAIDFVEAELRNAYADYNAERDRIYRPIGRPIEIYRVGRRWYVKGCYFVASQINYCAHWCNDEKAYWVGKRETALMLQHRCTVAKPDAPLWD